MKLRRARPTVSSSLLRVALLMAFLAGIAPGVGAQRFVFSSTPLGKAVLQVGQAFSVPVVCGPGLTGDIGGTLEGNTALEVLTAMAAPLGYRAEFVDGYYLVTGAVELPVSSSAPPSPVATGAPPSMAPTILARLWTVGEQRSVSAIAYSIQLADAGESISGRGDFGADVTRAPDGTVDLVSPSQGLAALGNVVRKSERNSQTAWLLARLGGTSAVAVSESVLGAAASALVGLTVSATPLRVSDTGLSESLISVSLTGASQASLASTLSIAPGESKLAAVVRFRRRARSADSISWRTELVNRYVAIYVTATPLAELGAGEVPLSAIALLALAAGPGPGPPLPPRLPALDLRVSALVSGGSDATYRLDGKYRVSPRLTLGLSTIEAGSTWSADFQLGATSSATLGLKLRQGVTSLRLADAVRFGDGWSWTAEYSPLAWDGVASGLHLQTDWGTSLTWAKRVTQLRLGVGSAQGQLQTSLGAEFALTSRLSLSLECAVRPGLPPLYMAGIGAGLF